MKDKRNVLKDITVGSKNMQTLWKSIPVLPFNNDIKNFQSKLPWERKKEKDSARFLFFSFLFLQAIQNSPKMLFYGDKIH